MNAQFNIESRIYGVEMNLVDEAGHRRISVIANGKMKVLVATNSCTILQQLAAKHEVCFKTVFKYVKGFWKTKCVINWCHIEPKLPFRRVFCAYFVQQQKITISRSHNNR